MSTKTASHTTSKQADKDPVPIVRPGGTEPTRPQDLEPLDKGNKRAYQTSAEPGQREYLTKDEAKKRGFHWADNEDKDHKGKKKT